MKHLILHLIPRTHRTRVSDVTEPSTSSCGGSGSTGSGMSMTSPSPDPTATAARQRVWDRAPWWLMAAATVYIAVAVLAPSLRVVGLIAGGYLLPFALVGLIHRHRGEGSDV